MWLYDMSIYEPNVCVSYMSIYEPNVRGRVEWILHVGDVDSAYAEVLSSGDDVLIVKLMERTGPIIDQLSNEVASEVLHAVGGQFLLEQSTFDFSLAWIQQFTELILENGADFLQILMEVKKEILLSLNEVSRIDPPEEWDGGMELQQTRC